MNAALRAAITAAVKARDAAACDSLTSEWLTCGSDANDTVDALHEFIHELASGLVVGSPEAATLFASNLPFECVYKAAGRDVNENTLGTLCSEFPGALR